MSGTRASKAVGIYWGTFDPPTLAHRTVIENSVSQLKLSELIVVVNDNKKTGKTYQSPASHRMKMLRCVLPAAIQNQVRIKRQTDSNELSYKRYKESSPDKTVYCIAGQDSLEKFLMSKDGAFKAKDYDHIVVVPRGDTAALFEKKIAEMKIPNVSLLKIDSQYLSISSTDARKAAQEGKQDILANHLDQRVAHYTQTYGFFKSGYTAKHHRAAHIIQCAYRNYKKHA